VRDYPISRQLSVSGVDEDHAAFSDVDKLLWSYSKAAVIRNFPPYYSQN